MNNTSKKISQEKMEIEFIGKMAHQIVKLFCDNNFTIEQATDTLNNTANLLLLSKVNQ